MVHRGIATISGVMMLCFLSFAQTDEQFFFLHFYESLIYLAIILMLFYLEDRWAYMLGMLAPAVWILWTIGNGGLLGAIRQISNSVSSGTRPPGISVMTLVTVLVGILMIGFCAQRWKREFAGLGKGWSTFLASLVIIIVYYGILWFWFGSLFPRGD